ncbi:MAG: response regulator [Candidatus Melainabacteria bacterium]|nr:response regulator [Candidatus Melainabacteria bacterium]
MAEVEHKKERILIVEDERRIAEILNDYLSQSGYEVDHQDRGDKIVELVKKNPPSLILLDVMLPGGDGLEICREIRKFSEVPIIIVSARIDELDRLLGLELGADDYICKPFSPREVVARVKAVFRRSRSAPEAESKLINIDDEKNRITVNGVVMDLTPTEFRLLKLFASKPGRVFSRNQLLELCYQQEQLVFDRVIDSHVKNVRKKLSKVLPGQELIHAVYGVGYRYEVKPADE